MTTVFVSGTFDLFHAGHAAFLEQALDLGDKLIVCLPTDRVVRALRHREPATPLEQKLVIFDSLTCVDNIYIGDDDPPHLNFASEFLKLKPHILAVTEDDQHEAEKRALCKQVGAEYVRLSKMPCWKGCSATEIRKRLAAPAEVPARVDFAGGWLDVPANACQGGYIVNCTITPGFSFRQMHYPVGAGLGGSAAYALLEGKNGVQSELDAGVGWQDPAILQETGLCVWQSGSKPKLWLKISPDMLRGRMALYWTGKGHDTSTLAEKQRDYAKIRAAGFTAYLGVRDKMFVHIRHAIKQSYAAQLAEGMAELPDLGAAVRKYCGSGWGGFALYLYDDPKERDAWMAKTPDMLAIEPFIREW